MPVTTVRGAQILDGTVQRVDLDATTVGAAVIRKIVQGTGITISSTGADSGTGDVTVNAVVAIVFDPVVSGPVDSSVVTGDDDDKVTVA